MKNVKIISNFDLGIDIPVNQDCELYIDRLPTSPKNCIRILWVIEPDNISGLHNQIIERHQEFDLILCWCEHILNNTHNSKLFPFGTSWVKNFNLNNEKEYCVTSLIGGKVLTDNHSLRHQLPLLDGKSSIPIHLFNSINNPFKLSNNLRNMTDTTYKNELFYSQYHIAIENVTINNWFTEKLIDCFQTKTIPIYLGCDNIGDFFKTEGMIIITNFNDLIEVCNSLTPETYNNMLKFVDVNYELSHKYANFRDTIKSVIINFVND